MYSKTVISKGVLFLSSGKKDVYSVCAVPMHSQTIRRAMALSMPKQKSVDTSLQFLPGLFRIKPTAT